MSAEPDLGVTVETSFVMYPTAVINSGISDRAFRVYGFLRSYVRPGSPTFPSYTTLMEKFGVSKSYLQRGITELAEAKLIVRQTREGKTGARTSNLYQFPNLPDNPPESKQNRGRGQIRTGARFKSEP